jgi:hypothetical protein
MGKACMAAAILLGVLASEACSHEPQAAAAAPLDRAAASPADRISTGSDVPHGDHNPHHGGVVFMHGELHFEVVLDRTGHHRIYFSDAVRADLPASVASAVSLVITRAGGVPESLSARIDESGESWAAEGQPVETPEATARIAFSTGDGSYWIDTPFRAVP